MVGMFAITSVAAAPREGLSVGLVIPQEGPFETLGAEIRETVSLWSEKNPGAFADIVEADDACDAESGESVASAMAEAGVDIAIGFLCPESLAAALPVLAEEGIPAMTLTVRAAVIGEEAKRLSWPFFRFAPISSAEAGVAAEAIRQLWAGEPFALVEDGTIPGRELAEAVRIRLEDGGLQPTFVDNYRPGQDTQPSLIRRLKAAGVTHVFAGGERADLAVIAAEADYQNVSFTFMGGDQLNAAAGDKPLPDGTLAILASTALPGEAARDAIAALGENGWHPDGLRLHAWAACDILGTLSRRYDRARETDIGTLLRGYRFATALGPVTFDAYGERTEPGFVLAEWRNGAFKRLSLSKARALTE